MAAGIREGWGVPIRAGNTAIRAQAIITSITDDREDMIKRA
jgi:hypothetical protein